MRRLIVSMNVTLDGYMSSPDGSLDWHVANWSDDMGERLARELDRTDTLLLGRATYEAMAAYWPERAMGVRCPRADIAYAVMMNKHHKIVWSQTLKYARWENSAIINGDVAARIGELKQTLCCLKKDIMIYGSGQLVHALASLGLIDEYQLWVHPVVISQGRRLFANGSSLKLRLTDTERFASGVVLMKYMTGR